MINIKLVEINHNTSQPKNETVIHNTLKEIGKYFLFQQGCRIIATEVSGMNGRNDDIRKSIMSCGLKPLTEKEIRNMEDNNIFINGLSYIEYNNQIFKIPKSRILTTRNKDVADVVGIKIQNKWTGEPRHRKYTEIYDTICIEAKASLSDYKNGFCYGASKTYVIAPKGIIPVEYINKEIGLIEVDMDNFKIINGGKDIQFEGVEIVKKSKKRLDDSFKSKEDFQEQAKQLITIMGKRCTNELLFWNNKVPLYKWVR